MSPFLSILLPTCGHKDPLHAFLISLCSSSLAGKAFEVLVSDNSSAPLLEPIDISFYSSRLPSFSYVHNSPSCTAVQNWNTLLGRARGKFVWVCHHDEYLAQASVRFVELLDMIEFSNSFAFVLPLYKTNCFRIFSRKITLLQKHSLPTLLVKYFLKVPILFFCVNVIGPPSCIIHRRDLRLLYDEKLSWLVDVNYYYSLFTLIRFSDVIFLSSRKFKIIGDQTFVDTLTASLSGSLKDLRMAEVAYLRVFHQLPLRNFLSFITPFLRLFFLMYRLCFTRLSPFITYE